MVARIEMQGAKFGVNDFGAQRRSALRLRQQPGGHAQRGHSGITTHVINLRRAGLDVPAFAVYELLNRTRRGITGARNVQQIRWRVGCPFVGEKVRHRAIGLIREEGVAQTEALPVGAFVQIENLHARPFGMQKVFQFRASRADVIGRTAKAPHEFCHARLPIRINRFVGDRRRFSPRVRLRQPVKSPVLRSVISGQTHTKVLQ